MSTVDICQKILRWPPDVKRLNGCTLKVSTHLCRCHSVVVQAGNCEISGWTQTNLWTPQEDSIEALCQGTQSKESRQDSQSRTGFSVVLCNATS